MFIVNRQAQGHTEQAELSRLIIFMVTNLLKHYNFSYIPAPSSISIKYIVFFLLGCWKHFRIIIQNVSKSSHFLSWGLILWLKK